MTISKRGVAAELGEGLRGLSWLLRLPYFYSSTSTVDLCNVCVVCTLKSFFYPTAPSPAHPVSLLMLHPRDKNPEITDRYETEKTITI